MKSLVKIIVILVVLGAGAGGFVAWRRTHSDQPGSYRTAPVRLTDLVSTISATGTIVPEDVVDVGAQVNGQIASFGTDSSGKEVDYRSAVTEGMLLAQIDDSLYQADVATSEAQLAQAQAQVRVGESNRDLAKARLDQAQRDWARAQKLGQSEALATADFDAARSTFEQAQASVGVAEASILQAKAAVAMAEASVQRSRHNLKYCTINSPVDGTIIDRRVEIGQTVVASLNAPSLFLIAKDLSRMQVLVQVNEADIGHVHPGQRVAFTVEAFSGQIFQGEVRKVRLNATMSQNVVTYTVEIVTENPDQKLLPYLTANVTFEVDRREHVLAVPNAALRWSPSDASDAAPTAASPPPPTGATPTTQPEGATRAGAEGAAGSRGAGRPRGESGAAGRGVGGREHAQSRTGTLWTLEDGQPRAHEVKVGLSDGALTEVEGDGIAEGVQIIIGEAMAGASRAAAPAGASPFTPQIFNRRGGR